MGDEYDAFGRKIGEDSLSGLGWSSGGTAPPPAPQPVTPPASPFEAPPQPAPVAAAPSAAAPPPLAPPPPSPLGAPGAPPANSPFDFTAMATAAAAGTARRRSGFPWGGLITLIVLVAIAGGVFAIAHSAEHQVNSAINGAKSLIPTPASPESPSKPAKPAVGLQAGSLVRPEQLARTMAVLNARHFGKLQNLRVAPDRVNAMFNAKGGGIKIVQVNQGPSLSTVVTTPGGSLQDTFAASAVHPAAAARLLRTAAKRLHQSINKVDYLVLNKSGFGLRWVVYFKNRRYAIGDSSGRFQQAF